MTTARNRNPRLVVQVWLGTRLVMLAMALVVMHRDGAALSDVFRRWDANIFLDIATHGYANPNDVAFFPGWPMLVRLVSLVPGVAPELAGVLLALVASGFAAAALYRMGGTSAAVAWLLAPAAVFTMVPYSEAIFCAAAFWAWERALARRWPAAAVLAAVAAATRVSGSFLIIALAVLALTQAGRQRARLRNLAWLAVPSAVVFAYLAFLRVHSGAWTAWYDAQAAGWQREFTWPWIALQHTIEATLPGSYADLNGWSAAFRLELVSMAVGLALTVICLLRKRWAEAVWVGLQVAAFSVSYWFMSVNRAALLWFPLWLLIGRLVLPRRGAKASGVRTVAVGVLAGLAVLVQAAWALVYFGSGWAS